MGSKLITNYLQTRAIQGQANDLWQQNQQGGSGISSHAAKHMQAVLEQNVIAERLVGETQGTFGKKIGLFGMLFGCWHKALSRPFTNKRGSYRTCLECGTRAAFDIESFRTLGTFYYPPSVAFDRDRTNS
jgi:hypothetical protein